MIPRSIIRLSFTAAALLLMVGCLPQSTTPTAVSLTPVSIQLSWTHEYSSAPFYAALDNGHYANEHLQVTLQAGGFEDGRYINPVSQVVDGTSTFGMQDASSLIATRADEQPVRAVMTFLQRSPTAVISLTSANIQQPADLIGKTVAANDGGATNQLLTMLRLQGIDPVQVNIIPRADFGVAPLTSGTVDALVGWIINEGVQVREAGETPSFMLFSDYGVPAYTFTLFTTDSIIENQPQLVEGVVRATIAGMRDMISDPAAVIDLVLKRDEQLDRAQQLERLQSAIPLFNPPGINLGTMSPETWDAIYQVLDEDSELSQPVDVTTVYTLEFLNRIYAQAAS